MRLPILTASIVALTVVFISIHSLGIDYVQASEPYTFLSQRGASANRILTKYIEEEIGVFESDFSTEDIDRIDILRSEVQSLIEELDIAFFQGDRTRLVDSVSQLNPYIDEIQALRNKYRVLVLPDSSEAVDSSIDTATVSTEMTYYADFFDGRTAANGETFYNNGWFSAAKCEVAFNTLTQAMYENKSVLFHINDRPHCGKHPDVLDLSQETFQALAPKSVGRMHGSQQYLREAPADFYKHYFVSDVFTEDGVDFEKNIPNMYLEGETFVLSGERGSCINPMILEVRDPVGNTYDIIDISSADDCSFLFVHTLAITGSYQVSLKVRSAGIAFPEMELKTYSPDWFADKVLFPNTIDTSVLSFSRQNISELGIYLDFSDSNLFYRVVTNAGTFFGVGGVLLPSEGGDIESISLSPTSTGYSHDTYEQLTELSI